MQPGPVLDFWDVAPAREEGHEATRFYGGVWGHNVCLTIHRKHATVTTATTTRYSGPFVEDVRSAAAKAGIRLEPILIGGPSELRAAFAAMAKAGAQAVIVQPFFDPHHVIIIDLAAKYRIAYMSGSRDVTAEDGLVSMAANWPELYERAAFYVDKILKGAKPADSNAAARCVLIPS